MEKTTKIEQFQKFNEKHRKKIIIFNIIIWIILLLLIVVYKGKTADYISREEIIQEIEKRCSNPLIIPENEAFNVIFTYNAETGLEDCEIVTK